MNRVWSIYLERFLCYLHHAQLCILFNVLIYVARGNHDIGAVLLELVDPSSFLLAQGDSEGEPHGCKYLCTILLTGVKDHLTQTLIDSRIKEGQVMPAHLHTHIITRAMITLRSPPLITMAMSSSHPQITTDKGLAPTSPWQQDSLAPTSP